MKAYLLVVYARLGLGFDEPRISCVRDEKELQGVVTHVNTVHPEFEVRWESVPWDHVDGDHTPGRSDLVHLVSVGAHRNLIGVRAFDVRDNADMFAADDPEYVVESCRLGEIDWEPLRG
ncbi:hypothetical protein [Sanguibacter suaedae]|uniref:Uncharacterized protein n=1 Tax=Sanguibacter suaedae TaxID=2795737 RepID=A0A934MAS8_9MICO|nr:hypothetical protein [Sanguibacter suaedae]MBI9115930.1 hypothetical protein [Sanguibacter suaedae]